ncbi:SH3 domain-containing protein [Micromonospora saelicesensis]|uniref:Bacterial SH3 domain n=1 Tax=Micromonospora saelicesensis TaxID=285676 RepID=A0A1C4YKL7_9ACTN|nr:SH3 domain-containing protein [Micromonospora saelicesensis]RAO46760.1 hypothetical protein GAR06_02646 [Micromonospora saelicesensis]SCF21269.1 Bacterial SH3 domain [Micromonospora saelicesensis]
MKVIGKIPRAIAMIAATVCLGLVSTGTPALAAPYTVWAWHDANVRSNTSTSASIVGKIYASNGYPAQCYVIGQTVKDLGYTNKYWVLIDLKNGGHGWVSGIYLQGDQMGNVNTEC